MGDSFRAGAGLAGESDEGEVRSAGQRGAVFLADEVGAVFGEIIGIRHNGILTGLEREAEGGSGWGLVLIKRRYKKTTPGTATLQWVTPEGGSGGR
jgi:hypothetical protein